MKLIHDFIQAVTALIKSKPTECPPSLFTDHTYLSKSVCHKRIIKILIEAGEALSPAVAHVSSEDRTFPDQGERKLHGGWKPDIVLENAANEPICFIEYESLNSSDERIFEKDIWKYQRWKPTPGIERAPLLVITTLKDGLHGEYRLEHAYNWKHKQKNADIIQNPFQYWYGHFRSRIYSEISNLPIMFANFNGNVLELVDMDLRGLAAINEARPAEPIADWERNSADQVGTPQRIIDVRRAYKTRLEGKTDVREIRRLLEEFWKEEQMEDDCWGKSSEKGFMKDVERVRNWQDGVRVIVNLQSNIY